MDQFKRAGDKWQAEKIADLAQTFGQASVIGTGRRTPSGALRYTATGLQTLLGQAAANRFLAEAEFQIGPAFEKALGLGGYHAQFGLSFGAVRPDLIQVLPQGTFGNRVLPSGDSEPLPQQDNRLQLRVIDIKLTAEPSPSYFAEVAYYTVALAGWLIDNNLDSQFVVVPEGAVWPGSHDASQLVATFRDAQNQGVPASVDDLLAALEVDLEPAPFDVFAMRVRRILQVEVPEVLGQRWQDLEWHVDNRCRNCEYLGYPWVNAQGQRTDHQDHCMPTAQRSEHLSRLAFMTRGARLALDVQGVTQVTTLAQRAANDPVFDVHQTLRATRTVVAGRAAALQTQQSHIPAASGTSAIMPRWADLRLHLSVDFDIGSAITVALGVKAFWLEPFIQGGGPRRYCNWGTLGAVQGVTGQPAPPGWNKPLVYVVDRRNPIDEQRELLALLQKIHDILTQAQALNPSTTVQFYLWDTLEYEHLTRIIGRHLQAILANNTLQYLAWLFPPEELLPNPAMATRRSPITIVRDVVRCMLAAPVAHYYSLLEIARTYHDPQLSPQRAQFSVHPLFEDALSDQIPSERAHEIWTRVTVPRHWQQQLDTLRETVEKRLDALDTVRQRLETDLRPNLDHNAPGINISPPVREARLSADSQLWFMFAKLNEVLVGLEVQIVRAMPPHEREARFHSARLNRRLTGADEQNALQRLGLAPAPGRMVYEMRDSSREVKVRELDFTFALAPENRPGFLDMSLQQVTQGTPLQPATGAGWNTLMESVSSVTVVAIDRDNRIIVLDPNTRYPTMIRDLETQGLASFQADVILDPVHHDFFTPKLRVALREIGNPPRAQTSPLVRQATGQFGGRGARRTAQTPAADFLWDAPAMYAAPVHRTLAPVQAFLQQGNVHLNPTQWTAWAEALSRRLQLIWGPPGTGKSRTIRSVVLGAVVDAHLRGIATRVLICTSTYTALDNVLLEAYAELERLLPGACCTRRIRSYLQGLPRNVPPAIDLELNRSIPSQQVVDLRSRLTAAGGTTLVGATPEQIHNLLTYDNGSAANGYFDLIVIDEASQMDVAHAVLPLCSLSNGGSVVLAGDPMQLPPIHQAEPPAGLEAMVGSVYAFCRDFHRIPDVMLDANYRSNSTIVNFSLFAGYRSNLTSFSPNMRLNLLSPVPAAQPPGWPGRLFWTPEWSAILDPAQPVVCFVYPDGRSSQWNQFEADAVCSLICSLYGRVGNEPLNVRDAVTGAVNAPSGVAYTPVDFWEHAIGVVTPHRAQQGLIVAGLQQVFAGTVPPAIIRNAVDTVERFQGQERDVIIASFAIGDPDAIQNEDEFLMSLNRFNVMASRPRTKLIVFVSREIVDHLSGEIEVLRESRLLKLFAESYCNQGRPMTLGVVENGVSRPVGGHFRHRI